MSLQLVFNNITNVLRNEWMEVQTLIKESVLSDVQYLNIINDHIFSSSGKMIRPLLALVSAKACYPTISKKAIVVAVASELIHNATLLHDDVVDDSDIRRGKKTVNASFSSGASVLLGDYWLSKAIILLIENNCSQQVLNYFAYAIAELARGEMLQMQRADDLQTSLEDYLSIISSKTGSLFTAAICGATFIIDSENEYLNSLKGYAKYLGISFQIRDDILDYSSLQKDGKDILSDIAERKITIPFLCACKNSTQLDAKLRALMSEIDILNPNKVLINEIHELVISNNGLEDAKTELDMYIQKAIDSIRLIPDSIYKQALVDISRGLSLS